MTARPRLLSVGVPLAVLTVVIVVLAAFVNHAQQTSRNQLDERFNLRAQIASRFVETYVADLVERQREIGERHLSGPNVSEGAFRRTATDGGYEAAVLLDRGGRLLRIVPSKPELLGADMTAKYRHLRDGVAGQIAVSNVVPSAAAGIPVVAFAVPFNTPQGRRVYSVAHDISTSPLGAYMRNVSPIADNRVFLLDGSGQIVATNQKLDGVTKLSAADPGLQSALATEKSGSYRLQDRDYRYAGEPIPGTPWRIVIAVPSDLLYNSIEGNARWIPWIAVFGFAIGGLLVVALLSRLLTGRARLAKANSELNRLSRVDSLTGLHNRRHVEEALDGLVSAAERHGSTFAELLIDIDRFKQVNDSYGHHTGDDMLCAVAVAIRSVLRTEDTAARWGGEEFLVVLPGESIEGAEIVGERIREAIAAVVVSTSSGDVIRVTATIGVAHWSGESVLELHKRADEALYRGKALGRDRVEIAVAVPSLSGS